MVMFGRVLACHKPRLTLSGEEFTGPKLFWPKAYASFQLSEFFFGENVGDLCYLSHVPVLAHHLLLLLRESQVIKESVPDHLKAQNCHLQSILEAP